MSGRRGNDLSGLRGRLESGFCASARRSRVPGWKMYDTKALTGDWLDPTFEILGEIRGDDWDETFHSTSPIAALAAYLSAHQDLLNTVLLSPGAVLGRMVNGRGEPAPAAVDAWVAMCWTVEAAWRAASSVATKDGSLGGDRDLLLPMAARARFLVLSEPMRWRAKTEGTWWARKPDWVFGGSGVLTRAFGEKSWGTLAERCAAARRTWLRFVGSYQSHPLLAQATSAEFEHELRTLSFRDGRCRGPLAISVEPLSHDAPLTAEDAAITAEITEQHLLPRFDLRGAAALAVYDRALWRRAARAGLAAAVVLGGVAAIVFAALLQPRNAAVLAAACYLGLSAGVVLFGTAWAAPWLLRVPAAAAIGFVALISMFPQGWLARPRFGLAGAALVAVAYGYLVIEVRNHGVSSGQALWRSLQVGLAGAAHALFVSLLGLVVVAPAFVARGGRLAALWRHPGGYRQTGMILFLASAWCLAVGVFSQILWDDRPITAPLAHLQWRSGR